MNEVEGAEMIDEAIKKANQVSQALADARQTADQLATSLADKEEDIDALIERLPEEDQTLAYERRPEDGTRQFSILEIANHAGEAGFTNHEIIVLTEWLYDEWGVYPATNKHKRYRRVLEVVRNVRKNMNNKNVEVGEE